MGVKLEYPNPLTQYAERILRWNCKSSQQDWVGSGWIGHTAYLAYFKLFNLWFNLEYIWNPLSMLFHPVKMMLKAFAISFKICSAYCAKFMPPIFFYLSTFWFQGNKKLKFTAGIDFYDFFRFWKRLKRSNSKFERTEFSKWIWLCPSSFL